MIRIHGVRLALLAAMLLTGASAEVWAQAASGGRPQHIERERLEKIEHLQREVERAARAYAERHAEFSRESAPAQRSALVRAQGELEIARANLNRELLQLMMRDVEPRQPESSQRIYIQRTPGASDTVMFFQPVQPRGWLGVSFSTRWQEETDAQGRKVWRFGAYPVIEAVEPGSPAERAGLTAGDVLVMIGGRDVVRGSAPFTELLRPGAMLPIQIRRGDQLRLVQARIVARPHMSFSIVTTGDAGGGSLQPGSVRVLQHEGARGVSVTTSTTRSGTAVAGTERVMLVPVPAAGSSALAAVAGAEVFPIGAGFRQVVGVDEGLLVLRVAPGTPSARAGIRSGDVIVSANGTRTPTSDALRAVLESRTSRSAAVLLMRDGSRQTVTLRW